MISKKNLISVELDPRAAKEFRKLSSADQKKIARKIDNLKKDPLTGKKLSGFPHLRRIRSGDYRIIYTFRENVLIILVLRIGHRRDVYRFLK